MEWPSGETEPAKYWLSTLSAQTRLTALVRLAKQRWIIERDYEELKAATADPEIGDLGIAREFGDDKHLAALQPVSKIDTGADRQRRHYRETGNWKALVDFMAKQLLQDLESNKPVSATPAAVEKS